MNNIWYHGTTATSAENIIKTGKFRVEDEEGSAFYVSRPGKVYISRDVGVGIQHGHTRVDMGHDTAFGILQLKLINPDIIVPDELELGLAITLAHRDHVLLSQVDDWEDIEDPYYPSAWQDESVMLYRGLWKIIPQDIKDRVNKISLDNLLDQEVGASLGDEIIDYFLEHDPDTLRMMVDKEWFFNYTTSPDNVIITGGWVGKLRDFQKPMRNINFDTEELDPNEVYQHMKIPMRGPIRTRGIGKGWHGEPYRHSLARRGLGTRRGV